MSRLRPVLLVAFLLAAGAAGCGGSGPGVPLAPDGAPPAFLVASADSALAAGDAERAGRLLDRALAAAPESAFVHVGRGRLQTALRRYKDAKESFDRAESLDPRAAEPAYWLGRAYQQAGDEGAAAVAYARALRRDPGYRPAFDALAPILGARYAAAGVPAEYALLAERPTISRAELAVVLAVELGADPDRTVWRSDRPLEGDAAELEEAWGGRWVRAAAARGWIAPFPDGTYRLEDPVTRAQLALALVTVDRRWSATRFAPADSGGLRTFTDLGPRHYLARAAGEAVSWGLPIRGDEERFEPWAAARGDEALAAVRGLARRLAATPIVSTETP